MAGEDEIKKPGAEGAELAPNRPDADNLAQVQAMEARAATTLITEGETTEHDPGVIAEKYIRSIPEQDRQITSAKQMDIILNALDNMRAGTALITTKDKLGNPPEGIQKAFASLNRPENRLKAIESARNFAADPVKESANADKTKQIANSQLPESIKNAILRIILIEGPQSAQQAFAELANRIERDTEHTIQENITAIINDVTFVSADADTIRRTALKKFLEGVYPDLMAKKEIVIIQRVSELSEEERNDNSVMGELLEAAIEAVGPNFKIDEMYQDELGGAEDLDVLLDGVRKGSVTEIDNIPRLLARMLKDSLKKSASKIK